VGDREQAGHAPSTDLVDLLCGGLERARELIRENERLRRHCAEVEEENNRLANLHAASCQLHAALGVSEVLQALIEIGINLIGAEVLAVYAYDAARNLLQPIAAEGRPLAEFPAATPDDAFIGRSLATGEPLVAGASSPPGAPLVSVPFRVRERWIGALVIHRLLPQKSALTPLDTEVFSLLASQGALALFAAQQKGP
jgi:K+-sensing histidine kinase KdpD